MTPLRRRTFLGMTGSMAAGIWPGGYSALAATERRMTIDLVCGAIGVRADQLQAVELAAKHGFESVGADIGHLARMSDDEIGRFKELLGEKGLVLGAAGLPVQFRQDEDRFKDDLARLPGAAEALRKAGGTRVGTWIMSNHDSLTYLQNLELHSTRLKQVASVLDGEGIRLGLEYVGPRTLWTAKRYPFVHSMAEMKELIAEIGHLNVGFVLDSWHWYTAEENEDDLLSLTNEQIVAVDLNDAPEGIPVHQQVDSRRRLPMATGVIDVKTFLSALLRLGYDGPVRAEPFDRSLGELPADEAVAKTAASMKEAFALI